VTDELPVHISRETLHTLEVPDSFQASDSFDVRLINHGESLHVHLHLDDPLSEVAAIDAGNHYVERESQRFVRVNVDTDRLDGEPVFGKLKVASAYGAETRWVDVEIVEPEDSEESVRVDESLSQPQRSPAESESSPVPIPELLVFGLGVLALIVAAVAALVIDQTIMLLGALIVLGGVLIAMFFLLQG
jgi:hypothetical protein